MNFAVFLEHGSIPEFRFSDANLAMLSAFSLQPSAIITLCHTEAEFLAALPATEIALVWRFKQEWFALAPRLKIISTPAAGRDYFHITPPDGVRVIYGSFHGVIMAETVLGMMLAAVRSQKRILRGSVVVILGFGNIGKHIARLLKPFGCEIIGITRLGAPGSRPASDLPQVLPRADHLVCVLPSDTGTDNILDAQRLALMKPTAFIYNVGRGNCIDENALCAALNEGRLAGAYLDVFKTEPLPQDSPLHRARNAILTPHISAVAPEYMELYVTELVEKLK